MGELNAKDPNDKNQEPNKFETLNPKKMKKEHLDH
jgi:hypothetical protein